ncbi:MAG: carbohydrate kinase family protein [Sulfobacillus sp.]
MKRLAILGNLNWDLVFHAIPDWPGWGREMFIDHAIRIPGGIAHAAMAARALGAEVQVIGCVGRDQAGSELISALVRHGIGTHATLEVEAITGLSAAIVKEDGERTYLTHPGALHSASPLTLWQHFLVENQHADILLISGPPLIAPSSYEEWVVLINEAHYHGVRVALDLGWDPKQNWRFWHGVLPLADIAICNEMEAAVYLDAPHLPDVVIVKSGATGATIIQPSGHTAVPGYPTHAVDTGGAGDVWNGAFLSTLMVQEDITMAVRWANAAGSLYVSQIAGTSRYPDTIAVQRVVERNN